MIPGVGIDRVFDALNSATDLQGPPLSSLQKWVWHDVLAHWADGGLGNAMDQQSRWDYILLWTLHWLVTKEPQSSGWESLKRISVPYHELDSHVLISAIRQEIDQTPIPGQEEVRRFVDVSLLTFATKGVSLPDFNIVISQLAIGPPDDYVDAVLTKSSEALGKARVNDPDSLMKDDVALIIGCILSIT
jgi:hypothetical protein